MKRGLNKADKTLLIVFGLFLLALYLHLRYPCSLVSDALLFASEAALVGGIADWFAVTALFRKPLGFPYHTAILPRRRDAFIKASVTLVQKEFFSKRKIFRHLERLHIMPMLLGWLREPANEARLVGQLVDYVRDFLMQQSKAQAGVIASKMREALAKVEPEDFFALWGKWLQKTGKDKEFVQRIAAYWRAQASTAAARQQIKALLEAYEEEKTGENVFAQLLAGFAQAVDLINYEEAAELIQRQLLAMLDELGTQDSPLQQEMLALFYEKAAELNREPQFHQLTHELKDSLLKDLPLENDELLHETVDSFLFDLLGRSALHAQTLVGVIVADVLSRLTDEQLNHLVYDKVEPDLLWIRMNGSIVGAGIGLLLFACLQITM